MSGEGGRHSHRGRSGILWLFLGLLFVLEPACSSNSNRANVLPPDVQYMADTMLSHRRRAIYGEMDSIYQERFDKLVQYKVDSLVALEKERIQNIIGDD